MGEAVEKRASEKKRTYVTPLPLLAQRVLKILPKTDDRVFPAFERKVYVIRKLVLAGWPTATSIGGGIRSRPGCRGKVTRRRTAGLCSITRTQRPRRRAIVMGTRSRASASYWTNGRS